MPFMTLPKLLRKSLFIALCACTLLQFAPAQAQSGQSELETISRQMFREGDGRFILVEALKDGFITEGQKYDLQYANGIVKINGKVLREPFQKHYNRLLKKFNTADGNTVLSMRGDGVKLRDVLNPESDFRTISSREKDNIVRTNAAKNTNGIIVAEMVADGIADTSKDLLIEYNSEGVFVNKQRLDAAAEEKYIARFQELGTCKPMKPGDGTTITITK